MSPLRESNCKQYLRKGKNAKLPSPNLSENSLSPAQDSDLMFFEKGFKRVVPNLSTVKGTSPLTLPTGKREGSMSVEAALVLPLFLFFFLNLGSAMEIMRLHGRLETALWEVGREAGVYGCILRGEGELEKETLVSEIGDLILSYTYVKGRIKEYLGKEYLDTSPLRDGSDGLHFLGSDLVNEEDLLEIVLTYQVEPFWKLAGFRSFFMENRYYGRMWTGYDLEKIDQTVYYLAENGEVYHRNQNCTHLMLHVQGIRRENLNAAVNREGRHYRACSKCVQGRIPEALWIAREGECYHARRECSGLKRRYRAVTWEEAKKYRPCSRCGKNKEK